MAGGAYINLLDTIPEEMHVGVLINTGPSVPHVTVPHFAQANRQLSCFCVNFGYFNNNKP